MPEQSLKCWRISSPNDDTVDLIVEESRGKALQRYADLRDMMFWEVVSKQAAVRAIRVPQYDGYIDHPGIIDDTAPYLEIGCWGGCYQCGREIELDRSDETFRQAVIIGRVGYCMECAGERLDEDDA